MLKPKTRKYKIGTPLIKFYNFQDFMVFGLIVDKSYYFYIVEWYYGDKPDEIESCPERSIDYYYDNYIEYRSAHIK